MALLVRFLPYAGWPLAALIFWFWIGVKEDLAAEVERCNADKLAAIATAESQTRQVLQQAFDRRIAELARQREVAENARAIAEAARRAAEARPEKVRTVIRRVADVEKCIDTGVPDVLVQCVRNPDKDCGAAGAGGSAGANPVDTDPG